MSIINRLRVVIVTNFMYFHALNNAVATAKLSADLGCFVSSSMKTDYTKVLTRLGVLFLLVSCMPTVTAAVVTSFTGSTRVVYILPRQYCCTCAFLSILRHLHQPAL